MTEPDRWTVDLPAMPDGWGLVLDHRTRRIDSGRVLVGGSPLRLLRLSAAGARMLDGWLAGEDLPTHGAGASLARRLLDAGIAHPRPSPQARPVDPTTDVTVVVPFHGPPSELRATLDDLAALIGTPHDPAARGVARQDDHTGTGTIHSDDIGGTAEVVVVDDGSPDPDGVAAVAARAGVRLERHEVNRGPGAARNTGWRTTDRPLIVFLDALVRPEPGAAGGESSDGVDPPVAPVAPGATDTAGASLARWLGPLVTHLGDPAVAAVAPRVIARPDPRTPAALAAYETAGSPLDLGPDPAVVRPGSPVPYVPTAALVVRRDDLAAVDGFDETLRHGEDVDLVWRLDAAGRTVRYEPSVIASHPTRPTVGAWLAQRFGYGASATPLTARHGRAVAPLRVSGWSAAAWGMAAVGHPAAGLAVAAGSTAALVRRLRGLDDPTTEAVLLAGRGHLHAGEQIGRAVRRAWLPLAVLAGVADRRARLPVATAILGPAVLDAIRHPGRGGARVRDAALGLVDDAAYCAGVWRGCFTARDPRALLPASSGPVRPPA